MQTGLSLIAGDISSMTITTPISTLKSPPDTDSDEQSGVIERWTDILEKIMILNLNSEHLLRGRTSESMQKQNQKLIFLLPENGNRDYTDEELEASQARDFETRLFMTSTSSCGGDSG